MNASPMTVTPSSSAAAAGQASSAKASDLPVDTPFSQVFSGELARKAGETSENVATDASALPPEALANLAETTLRLDYPALDAATAEAAAQAIAGAAQALAGAAVQDSAKDSAKGTADGTADASLGATLDVPVRPETLLALAVGGEAQKPETRAPVAAAAAARQTAVTPADVLGAARVAVSNSASQAGAAAQVPAGADTAVAATTTRGALPAAAAATAAAEPHAAAPDAVAFAERLAAARQAEPTNVGERLSELMSHPGMRAAAPAAPADAAPVDPSSRLAPSVGSSAWGQALGEKLVWMAAGNQQTASITLNPPNLGPLQIVVNVSNDQATANFFAAQPEVRQAIEAAFPKLREMMNDAGIQLGQATVSADTPRQQDAPQREAQRGAPSFAEGGERSVDPVVQHAVPLRQGGRGLVDTFA